MPITADDLRHLNRCVELAREALDGGDEPFGSMLVDEDGTVLFEDRNRVSGGDATQLGTWLGEWGVAPSPVAALPITAVAPGVPTDGPADELVDAMKGLNRTAFRP